MQRKGKQVPNKNYLLVISTGWLLVSCIEKLYFYFCYFLYLLYVPIRQFEGDEPATALGSLRPDAQHAFSAVEEVSGGKGVNKRLVKDMIEDTVKGT